MVYSCFCLAVFLSPFCIFSQAAFSQCFVASGRSGKVFEIFDLKSWSETVHSVTVFQMNSVDFRSVSHHKRQRAVRVYFFFPCQATHFFNLLLKARGHLNLLLRLPCGVAWSGGCCSSTDLWSSCPCWIRSGFHKLLCSAARLCSISACPYLPFSVPGFPLSWANTVAGGIPP